MDLTDAAQAEIAQYSGTTPFGFVGHVEGLGEGPSAPPALMATLAAASRIVSRMRQRIEEELGFTSCGGVSVSKLGAKVACETHKPHEQTTVLPGALPGRVGSMLFCSLQGVGGKICRAVHGMLTTSFPSDCPPSYRQLTCLDVCRLSKQELVLALGSSKTAESVHQLVRGA